MANKTGRTPKGPGETEGCRLLYNWIKSRDLTYTQAGELLGYPLETISRYVTGARRPDPETMFKLKALADIPMESWLRN